MDEFDYDPNEIVTWDQKRTTLFEAVADYRAKRQPGMAGPTIFREQGKEPSILGQEHLDMLMHLPEFQP